MLARFRNLGRSAGWLFRALVVALLPAAAGCDRKPEWRGVGTDLGLAPLWAKRSPGEGLFLGMQDARYEFHKVELRRITGGTPGVAAKKRPDLPPAADLEAARYARIGRLVGLGELRVVGRDGKKVAWIQETASHPEIVSVLPPDPAHVDSAVAAGPAENGR